MQLASGRLGRARTILFCAALSTALVLACGVLPGPTAEVAPSAAPPAEPGPAAAPTATPVAAATDTPAPAPTAAPPEPGPAPDFEALGQAAADYATASRGDPAALAQALEAWGMAPPKETSLAALSADGNVVAADLTGDGTEELVAVAMNPQPQMIMGEGTLLILATEG
ncbi:MAG: hypothetical protein HPY83_19400, partial [Anaerolineae bacterium]|nr:hypothetical protein [Anaerolineae bacterium]